MTKVECDNFQIVPEVSTISDICIIIPVYNEIEKVKFLIQRFPKSLLEKVVFVDDGSTDGLSDFLKAIKISFIKHKKRYGVGQAIKTGLKFSAERGYKVTVIMAGNNKDDPAQIQYLIEPILYCKADFVQGSRFLKGGEFSKMPFYRFIATRLIHPFLFSLKVGKFKTDTTNGFRAFKTEILHHPKIRFFNLKYNSYELEIIFYIKIVKAGFRCKEVAVSKIYPHKKLGITKIRPFIDWFKMLKPFFI